MSLEKLLIQISNFISEEIRRVKRSSFEEKELSRISLNHFYYLEAVSQLEHPTISSIADKLKVSKPSATVMINKLIAQDYLYKIQSSEDRRIYYIYLKEKGKLLVNAEKLAYKNVVQKINSLLSNEESTQLKNVMSKIANHLHEV